MYVYIYSSFVSLNQIFCRVYVKNASSQITLAAIRIDHNFWIRRLGLNDYTIAPIRWLHNKSPFSCFTSYILNLYLNLCRILEMYILYNILYRLKNNRRGNKKISRYFSSASTCARPRWLGPSHVNVLRGAVKWMNYRHVSWTSWENRWNKKDIVQ
jgi:hypothetical protein